MYRDFFVARKEEFALNLNIAGKGRREERKERKKGGKEGRKEGSRVIGKLGDVLSSMEDSLLFRNVIIILFF